MSVTFLAKQSIFAGASSAIETCDTSNESCLSKCPEPEPISRQLRHANPTDIPATDRWLFVLEALYMDAELRAVTHSNFNLLLITMKRFRCFKKIDPKFRELVVAYGTQDVLKALSMLFNLTEVKRNKYKFMYEGLALGKAVRLLIKEALVFHMNIVKKKKTMRFEEIIENWVDSLMLAQKVPSAAICQLKAAILEIVIRSIACSSAAAIDQNCEDMQEGQSLDGQRSGSEQIRRSHGLE